MNPKRLSIVLALFATAAMLVPASAPAKRKPVAFLYGASCTKQGCKKNLYTNATQKRIINSGLGVSCQVKGSVINVTQEEAFKVAKDGSFKGTLRVISHDAGGDPIYYGKASISGSVNRNKSAKIKWTIDQVAPGCTNAMIGSIKLKYKRAVYGG